MADARGGRAARRAWRRWAPELCAGGIDVDGPDELVPIILHPGGRPSRRRARYRELGYVALSRGRVSNRIWTVSDHDPEPTENPADGAETQPEPDPLVDLRQAMQRFAQQLATDQADELESVGIEL
jgi:hypothetical protein